MGRIRSVDIVRGSAMMLVVVAHSFLQCDPHKLDEWFLSGSWMLTQSASLTFMFVSGMIMTYLMRSRGDSVETQRRFFKRGLFLIILVHPVLRLVTFIYSNTQQDFLHNMILDHPITDTIGLCLLVAPFIVQTVGRRNRLLLVVAMLTLTLGTKLWWHPESGLALIIKVVLFGTESGAQTKLAIGWPVIPWLAIFLSGTFVGEMYSEMRNKMISPVETCHKLWKRALLLVSLGIGLSLLYWVLKHVNPFNWVPDVFVALYPTRTDFLLPLYLGIIFGLIAVLIKYVDYHGKFNRVLWAISVFGRTSLFTFVAQFIVVWTIPTLLGLKKSLDYFGFALLITIGLLTSWTAAYIYGRLRKRVLANDYQVLLGRVNG